MEIVMKLDSSGWTSICTGQGHVYWLTLEHVNGNVSVWINSWFLSGVKRELTKPLGDVSNCRDNFLKSKVEVSLPSKYVNSTFCAQNPSEEEGTCPGDSGK